MLLNRYFSVDIEASGSSPGKYSLLSIGACVVGDYTKTFYRELKPISDGFIIDAMRIGARKLSCLDNLHDHPEYDPYHESFNPKKVLAQLAINGSDARDVMQDYAQWVETHSAGYLPVEVATPSKYDGMFVNWYFDNFYPDHNPFGHRGEDIRSVYHGLMRDMYASVKELGLHAAELPHHALEDAIIQAKEFEMILGYMKR